MSANLPLVSVLMTAYNRENYVGEAIESVLASTYTNFELLIVDDCSKDNTVAIARSYAKKDDRITVFVNEQNLGDYNNRNNAASLAKGKYIKYWDSDDVMYPHCLDVMVRCMEQFPDAGFGLIKPHIERYPSPYPILIPTPFDEYVAWPALFTNSPGSAIINREVFSKVGGFSGKRYIGDFEFWLKISQHTKLVLIPGFLGWDRTHAGQERDFDVVAYEKMGIDVLMGALNTSKLENADVLKQAIVSSKLANMKKIMLKEVLSLRFSSLASKYKIMTYLQQKSKA